MPWSNRLTSFYRLLFRRSELEKELDAEVASYLETLVDRYMEQGMSRKKPSARHDSSATDRSRSSSK